MATIEYIETRCIPLSLELRYDGCSAAIERQDFILPAMRNVYGRLALTDIGNDKAWRVRNDVREEIAVDQPYRQCIRRAIRKTATRNSRRVDVAAFEHFSQQGIEFLQIMCEATTNPIPGPGTSARA